MTDSERLIALSDYLKIELAPLARSIGVSPDTLYHVRDRVNGISVKLAKKLSDKYDIIRYDWILKGQGEMLNNVLKEPSVSYEKDLQKQLDECRNKLKAVTEERDWLREFLKDISKNGSGQMSGTG